MNEGAIPTSKVAEFERDYMVELYPVTADYAVVNKHFGWLLRDFPAYLLFKDKAAELLAEAKRREEIAQRRGA